MKKKKVNELNKIKKEANDFKTFISRGNVVDMAVGVIVGGAFGKIVSSLVNDIIMPVIGVILGGLDFSGLTIKVGDASIKYGVFIQTIIDFIIISFCIYIMVRLFEKLKKNQEVETQKKNEEVILLEEIRDILKNNNK